MKKILKGFTLIELIIVMAVMSILMLGIMRMMDPIRTTYVDSTYYESQRTTQNGISTYIGESLRYATKLGIYTGTSSSDLATAVANFKSKSGYNAAVDGDINFIVIDNTTEYIYRNEKVHGRVLRNKKGSETETRMALGAAFYGSYNYSINLKATGISEKHENKSNKALITGYKCSGFNITVSSLLPSSLNKAKAKGQVIKTEEITSYECVMTEGEATCRNLSEPINGWSNVMVSGGTVKDSVYELDSTKQGRNIYIVFTLPKK
ncbi:MAG: type II secretion system protein [Oscillospiraceae bacterium]